MTLYASVTASDNGPNTNNGANIIKTTKLIQEEAVNWYSPKRHNIGQFLAEFKHVKELMLNKANAQTTSKHLKQVLVINYVWCSLRCNIWK